MFEFCEARKFPKTVILPLLIIYLYSTHTIIEPSSNMPNNNHLIQTCKEALKQLQELHTSFQCLICHAPIQNSHVISGCQHRFCGKCIAKSARRCNNECPECRMHIPLFSHLRRDTKYDELVSISNLHINLNSCCLSSILVSILSHTMFRYKESSA